MTAPPTTAADLRAVFDAAPRLTVGIEEECFLLDPITYDLLPGAAPVLARTEGTPQIKPEMPAAQVEIETPPAASVPEVIAALAGARAALLRAAEGIALPAALAAHPFADPEGAITPAARYRAILDEYGRVARLQLVCSLQVHVAIGDAAATIAVHDALRSYLPEIAALSAGAPYHASRDTGLASVRPKVCDLLPQQGIPAALETWDGLAEAWRWGATSGAVPDPGAWWWELRTHPRYGTLELRVPDAQPTIAAAGGVAAFVHCLVAWLLERHEAGEVLANDPTWRIEHNRWSACRYGVAGSLADLRTGARRPTRDVLHDRIDTLSAQAAQLGCTAELVAARDLVEQPTDALLRSAHAEGGLVGVAAWAASVYGEGLDRARSRLSVAEQG